MITPAIGSATGKELLASDEIDDEDDRFFPPRLASPKSKVTSHAHTARGFGDNGLI
jgi:hypothetical protein